MVLVDAVDQAAQVSDEVRLSQRWHGKGDPVETSLRQRFADILEVQVKRDEGENTQVDIPVDTSAHATSLR